jgi:hypothetical protein
MPYSLRQGILGMASPSHHVCGGFSPCRPMATGDRSQHSVTTHNPLAQRGPGPHDPPPPHLSPPSDSTRQDASPVCPMQVGGAPVCSTTRPRDAAPTRSSHPQSATSSTHFQLCPTGLGSPTAPSTEQAGDLTSWSQRRLHPVANLALPQPLLLEHTSSTSPTWSCAARCTAGFDLAHLVQHLKQHLRHHHNCQLAITKQ